MELYVLIGGIGSGKSTVSDMFSERGAACVDLDDCGHEVLADPEVIGMLVETFGEGILDGSGAINRAALAAEAFATPADTVKLNAISHPRLIEVAKKRIEACEEQGKHLIIVEISAYDGPNGTYATFVRKARGVIAVVAKRSLRIERAVAKGFDETDVRNRIARQVDDVQRQLWADYVIKNDGSLEDLNAAVDKVWDTISH